MRRQWLPIMEEEKVGIKTKSEFYEKYHKGVLGNKLLTWDTWEECVAHPYSGPIGCRYKLPNHPQYNVFNISKQEMPSHVEKFVKEGAVRDLINYGESPKDELLLMQGEFVYLDKLYLTYSYEKTNMRIAMKNAKHAYGSAAQFLLRHFTNENSWAMIEDLRELYPDYVFEFGVYDYCLGVLPHHNLIVWEVRSY
jgi:hypothetical protein